MGKEQSFHKWDWDNRTSTCKIMKPKSHYITKSNSKYIKDLNVTADIIKFLKENMGENLCDLGLSSNLLDKTLKI